MGPGSCKFIGASLIVFLFLHQFCYSENAPYSSFAKDAMLAPLEGFYDYIVIGGGTAGCPLAATLSEGAKVLLLERGDLPYGNDNITNIRGFVATLADTSPTSASQLFISTDGVINQRARVLGGGSAVNAGFYSRASLDYVKQVGWDQKLVNESYKWVEKKVAFEPQVLEWQSALKNGLLEAGVLPDRGFTYDHLYGTKVGGTIFDKKGVRHTAADLLEYAEPTNITLYLNATVQQILFHTSSGDDRPQAYGVAFKDANGRQHMAYLNQESTSRPEIILSAGAIGSPQLLMLSGIGPSEQLSKINVSVVYEQPMVGQGMADNPTNGIIVPSPRPVEVSLVEVVGITKFGSYIEELSGFVDLDYITRLAGSLGLEIPKSVTQLFEQMNTTHIKGGVILEKVMGPNSSGYLEVETIDPSDNPSVTFNYFQDPSDLQKCVQGINTIIKVIESNSFSKFRYPTMSIQTLINITVSLPTNLRPRDRSSAHSMEQFCKDTVMTIWHYHGGCQVDKVVDKGYKVLGVNSLRVIDGSTFINSPGTNPQATVMMLGRYMGQKILQERFSSGSN